MDKKISPENCTAFTTRVGSICASHVDEALAHLLIAKHQYVTAIPHDRRCAACGATIEGVEIPFRPVPPLTEKGRQFAPADNPTAEEAEAYDSYFDRAEKANKHPLPFAEWKRVRHG